MTRESASKNPRMDRLRNMTIPQIFLWALSSKWCGCDMVPLSHEVLKIKDRDVDYVFCFLNDSFEIGIGYPDQWHGIYRRSMIHKFIRWYLMKWIFFDWFGLRSYLYFKFLSIVVKGRKTK